MSLKCISISSSAPCLDSSPNQSLLRISHMTDPHTCLPNRLNMMALDQAVRVQPVKPVLITWGLSSPGEMGLAHAQDWDHLEETQCLLLTGILPSADKCSATSAWLTGFLTSGQPELGASVPAHPYAAGASFHQCTQSLNPVQRLGQFLPPYTPSNGLSTHGLRNCFSFHHAANTKVSAFNMKEHNSSSALPGLIM